MIVSEKSLREFEKELSSLYPFLTECDTKDIIKDLVNYWGFILTNV